MTFLLVSTLVHKLDFKKSQKCLLCNNLRHSAVSWLYREMFKDLQTPHQSAGLLFSFLMSRHSSIDLFESDRGLRVQLQRSVTQAAPSEGWTKKKKKKKKVLVHVPEVETSVPDVSRLHSRPFITPHLCTLHKPEHNKHTEAPT